MGAEPGTAGSPEIYDDDDQRAQDLGGRPAARATPRQPPPRRSPSARRNGCARGDDELTCVVWCWIARSTAELLPPGPGTGERVHELHAPQSIAALHPIACGHVRRGIAMADGLLGPPGEARARARGKTFDVALRRGGVAAQKLTPEQYRVLREHGTERAGTSPLDKEYDPGVYHCAGCGAAAVCSPTPSSTAAPAGRASTRRSTARSRPRPTAAIFMIRTEVHCPAAAAISAMSSTTGRSRPGSAIA